MRRLGLALLLAVILAACGDSADDGPLQHTSAGGSWFGWGRELNGRGGLMVHGELRLINESDQPAVITSVTPNVEAGSMEITRLGLLGSDRPSGSFDNMPGSIEELDFGTVIDIDDVAIPPEDPDRSGMFGHILLVEFRITGDDDLYFAGFDIEYTIGDRSFVLSEYGGGTLFCIPYVEGCGEAYGDQHSEKYGPDE